MGAFVTTKFAGLEVNIYFQIALIMLLGLLAKNAILIVEFAIQRRKAGLSIVEAAFEGARVRLRPILMTSFAFIVGLLRSEEHTSELQSLMRISYAVFCLKKKK